MFRRQLGAVSNMDIVRNFTRKQFMSNKILKTHYKPNVLQAVYELLQADGFAWSVAQLFHEKKLARVILIGDDCLYIDLL
jgi:cytolysin (calcineurin-like family phosphatase)